MYRTKAERAGEGFSFKWDVWCKTITTGLRCQLDNLRNRGYSSRAERDLLREGYVVRPQNVIDWIAFVFLIVGAFAWGFFVTDINILDVALEAIWDPLDDLVFILIFLSGLWGIFWVFGPGQR